MQLSGLVPEAYLTKFAINSGKLFLLLAHEAEKTLLLETNPPPLLSQYEKSG